MLVPQCQCSHSPEDQPLVLRPQTLPDQRRPQVSTPRGPLPEEEVEQPEGAIGREV